MVAVLRAEIEQFDEEQRELTRERHLHLVDTVTEGPVSIPQTGIRRQTQAIYWRRRITCLTLLVGLLWMMSSAAGLSNSDRSAERPEARTLIESAAGESLAAGQIVIVKPGDTLWSIARKMQPTGDVRPLVDRIATLNNGHALIAGQALLLP